MCSVSGFTQRHCSDVAVFRFAQCRPRFNMLAQKKGCLLTKGFGYTSGRRKRCDGFLRVFIFVGEGDDKVAPSAP